MILSDWFKVLAPFFQPIRSETKTNRGSYHLKCLGADFETSKKCFLCSDKEMDSGGESGVDCTVHFFNIATELREAIKLRGLKFVHQNIRSIRGKLNELNILVSQCPNLHSCLH